MLGILYFQNLRPGWWRAWNSNLLFCHLLLLLDSVRISECFSVLCLQFILHHNLRLYQHVKDDSTGCSHHAVSHIWQDKGSEKLWWGAGKKEQVWFQRGQREVLEKEALFFCKSAQWKCVAFVCPVPLWWIAPSLLLNASDGATKTKHRVTSICPPHPYYTSLPELLVIDGWNKMWQGPWGLRVLDFPLTPVIYLILPWEGLAQCKVFTDVCGMKEWMKEGLEVEVAGFAVSSGASASCSSF